MAHDVFVSHSSKDKTTADAVCAALESEGIRCWVAPRDIIPGTDWGASIIDAINGTRVMLLIFSADANVSPQIQREVERAVNKRIPIIPMRIANIKPTGTLEYFLSAPHWLDAFPPPLERHFDRLKQVVQQTITRTVMEAAGQLYQEAESKPEAPRTSGAPNQLSAGNTRKFRRGALALAAVLMIMLAFAGGYFGPELQRMVPKSEQKVRQEAENKRLADEKAKAEAAAEAKAREEERLKAEAPQKARQEADDKRLADEKANAKALADAKALEDARLKAEAEQKARQEAEDKNMAEESRKAKEAEAQEAAKEKAAQELAAKQATERKAKEVAEKARLAMESRKADELAVQQAADAKAKADAERARQAAAERAEQQTAAQKAADAKALSEMLAKQAAEKNAQVESTLLKLAVGVWIPASVVFKFGKPRMEGSLAVTGDSLTNLTITGTFLNEPGGFKTLLGVPTHWCKGTVTASECFPSDDSAPLLSPEWKPYPSGLISLPQATRRSYILRGTFSARDNGSDGKKTATTVAVANLWLQHYEYYGEPVIELQVLTDRDGTLYPSSFYFRRSQ
jgi:hypothetical protein